MNDQLIRGSIRDIAMKRALFGCLTAFFFEATHQASRDCFAHCDENRIFLSWRYAGRVL